MLGSLSGTITARLEQRILVEVNRVGYWVFTGSWQPNGEITCYIHHHVREDASVLYGFSDIQTLQLFEQLISISGIGPKAALAILSLGSNDSIRTAIAQGDSGFLSMAPGIGQKAAQKIILELKGKLPELSDVSSTHQDVIAALESLGYKANDIRAFVNEMPAGVTDLNDQIRWTLQQLAR